MSAPIFNRHGDLPPAAARMLILLFAIVSATTVLFAFARTHGSPAKGVVATRVTSNSALLLARTPDAGRVRFEVSSHEDFSTIDVFSFDYVERTERTARAWLTGLRPGTHYFCRSINAEGACTTGQFTTGGAM